jgi:uncharacterized protein
MGLFSSKETKLLDAAFLADIGEVRELIKKGANVNARDDAGHTVLMQAAACLPIGRVFAVDLVKLLLDQGADIEAKDKRGQTALFKASNFGLFDVVTLLVQKGADTGAKDNEGKTALMRLREKQGEYLPGREEAAALLGSAARPR